MGTPSNDWYTSGLKEGKREVIQSILDNCGPLIQNWVKRNSGSLEDSKDIMMYALKVCYQNVQKKDFKLTVTFCSYFFGIGKNYWLNQLRNSKKEVTKVSDKLYIDDGRTPHEILEEEERASFIQEHFHNLSIECQEIIDLCWYSDRSSKEIAEHFNLKEDAFRKRKSRCINKYKLLLRNDPRLR